MFLFIFLPIISVVNQSLFTPHNAVLEIVKTCGPFGCTDATTVNQQATEALRSEQPMGKFAGLEIYLDRGHLAVNEVAELWRTEPTMGAFFNRLGNLPFYRAMGFTLSYVAVVTPFVIVLGLVIALAVNSLHARLKGLVIFFSLLPFIVPPLIGSLILFWMVDSRGVFGSFLQYLFNDPTLSLKASTSLTWIMLMVYGVWHSAPFAFVIFYAGLQTVPQDTIESAVVDGATRWEQTRYVVIPHLMPLVTFVALMQLMDNFRVFEPIIGFNAEAHATSLSWIIFNDLGGETRLLSSAATTSVLTILGIAVLLSPVLVRTWRDFHGKTH